MVSIATQDQLHTLYCGLFAGNRSAVNAFYGVKLLVNNLDTGYRQALNAVRNRLNKGTVPRWNNQY